MTFTTSVPTHQKAKRTGGRERAISTPARRRHDRKPRKVRFNETQQFANYVKGLTRMVNNGLSDRAVTNAVKASQRYERLSRSGKRDDQIAAAQRTRDRTIGNVIDGIEAARILAGVSSVIGGELDVADPSVVGRVKSELVDLDAAGARTVDDIREVANVLASMANRFPVLADAVRGALTGRARREISEGAGRVLERLTQ